MGFWWFRLSGKWALILLKERLGVRAEPLLLLVSDPQGHGLFPFDGGWGLGGYVVDHTVDFANFVHDTAGHAGQHIVGYLRPGGGHAVYRGDGAYGDHVG